MLSQVFVAVGLYTVKDINSKIGMHQVMSPNVSSILIHSIVHPEIKDSLGNKQLVCTVIMMYHECYEKLLVYQQ